MQNQQEKIFIVENESIIAKDLELSLTRLGWPVCGIAYSGKDALEKVRILHPDLILMDIKLGKGIDGVEAARNIADFSDIPIFYLTAYADEETLNRAKSTHPYGYIVKPIEERNLQVTIEMGLHHYFMEKQLKEKDKWLEMIIENLDEGFVVIDHNGVIQLINPAAEFYTGWKKEAAIGLPYQDVLDTINDYTGEAVNIPFFRAMEEVSEVALIGNVCLMGLNGSKITIDGKCIPVVDAKGKITGAMLVFHDITQRKRLENKLRQAQKMEAIGTLAGGIAHDFNNILSAIQGNTELTLKKLPQENKVKQYLNQVLNASNRARDLVKQIFTFSRQSKNEKMPVQVSLIVKEVLQLLRSSIPDKIDIHQDIKASNVMVMANPVQIHQILMNLCTNSLHAMKKTGGVLSVSLEEIDTSLCISISDTGYGMDSLTMTRIFEPYFTTKSAEDGTGMGLAVVHGIIKDHQGTIDVTSTPGKGTTFDVFLPKISNFPKKSPIARLFNGNKKRILFVDDEQPLVELGQELLGQFGYIVEGRTNSIKALEDFRQTPQKFDLAILDFIMPQMSGTQLAKKIREIRPDFPIILCTGFSEFNAAKYARDACIEEIVMKPIIKERLSLAIRNLLDIDKTDNKHHPEK